MTWRDQPVGCGMKQEYPEIEAACPTKLSPQKNLFKIGIGKMSHKTFTSKNSFETDMSYKTFTSKNSFQNWKWKNVIQNFYL